MDIKKIPIWALLIVLALLAIQCSRRGNVVVAEVGGKKITAGDIEEAFAKLRSAHAMTKDQVLWTLIDKELLAMESRNRGLDKSEKIQKQLEEIKRQRIKDALSARLTSQISVSDKEVRQYFEAKGLETKMEVRAAHIMLKTRKEAEDVLKAIRQGADFAQLARERSIEKVTAEKGGDLGYWEPGVVVGPFAQKVFSMKVGEISEPFQDQKGYYHIIKVLDKRPVGFERQKPRIENLLRRQKLTARKLAYLAGLREKYHFHIDPATFSLLLKQGESGKDRTPQLEFEDHRMVLATWDGGQLTLNDYVEYLRRIALNRRPTPTDSTQVTATIGHFVATEFLLPKAWRELKLDRTKELQSYLAVKKEELMAVELRYQEAVRKVITEDAIREYYQEHLEDYLEQETITVEAMFVKDKDTAETLRRKIEKGAEMTELARTQSFFFPEQRENYAIFSLRPSDKETPRLRKMVEAAEKARVGQLVGPVEVPFVVKGRRLRGYTVFKVLKKERRRQRSLEDPEVWRSVERRLRAERAQEIEDLFQDFLSRLHKKYAEQITIYEEGLKAIPEASSEAQRSTTS
ncbi:MAG TPA: hypothetical protein EYP53_07280 [Candidatus Latescibacteria bacterium]|nr:hypothetical protein [Candidatus Latescibacterota bacterium]